MLLLLFLGLLITSFTTLFISIGIQYSTIIHSSLIVNSSPLFVALLAPFIIKEKTNWKKILAVEELLKKDFLFGISLLFSAALCQVFYTIFVKKYLQYYSAMTIVLYATLVGFISMFFLSLFSGKIFDLVNISAVNIVLLVLIGTLSTVIPLVIFSSSVKHLGSVNASSFKFFIPIFAILFAVLFFQENLSVWIGSGFSLTALGIYFTQKISVF